MFQTPTKSGFQHIQQKGMVLLHPAISPDLNIVDTVYVAFPCDLTMQVNDEQLGWLFAMLQHLHLLARYLTKKYWRLKMTQSHPCNSFG